MTKQTYRFTRQHNGQPTGTEIELTEGEAIRLNNEAPGVVERVETRPPQASQRPPKPVVKEDI